MVSASKTQRCDLFLPRAKMLKKAPAFSATAFKHRVESRKCRVIAVSLCDIGIGAGAELGADTVGMDALLRVRNDTGSFSKAIYINNLLVEANLYSATTRTKGCILTVQNSNAFSADTLQEFTSDNTKHCKELTHL